MKKMKNMFKPAVAAILRPGTAAALASFAALCLSVSCTVEETTTVIAPELGLSESVSAAVGGGEYSIAWAVSNPADGGSLSCAADVTWIEDLSVSNSGVINFTVQPNTGAMRCGTITVTYRYDGGYSLKRAGVVQDGADGPSVAFDSDLITLDCHRQDISLTYTVSDGVYSPEIDCTADVDWIGSFDCSADGAVAMSVSNNSDFEPRTGTVTLTYSWSGHSVSASVTVIQDYAPNGGHLEYDDLFGTYTCSGFCAQSSTTGIDKTWEMTIMRNDSETNYVYLDGIVPYTEGAYATYGSNLLSAVGFFYELSQTIVIPSEVLGTTMSGGGNVFFFGFTPCVAFEDGFMYSQSYPSLTLTYNPATETWESDYGILAVGCASQDISTIQIMFDAVAPGFSFTRKYE